MLKVQHINNFPNTFTTRINILTLGNVNDPNIPKTPKTSSTPNIPTTSNTPTKPLRYTPKSASFTCPFLLSRIFAALMSLCILFSCSKNLRPSRTWCVCVCVCVCVRARACVCISV